MGGLHAGNASLQMGDLEKADIFFKKAFEFRYIKNRRAAIDALAGHALCMHLIGRAEKADEYLKEAREFAYWAGDPAYLDVVDSCRARIDLLRGDDDSAARWLASYHDKAGLPVRLFFLEYPEITACRILVARGTPESLDQVAARLDLLEAESRGFYHDCQLLPVLVMKSLLYFKTNRVQNRPGDSLRSCRTGLARPMGTAFHEGGAPVAELLSQLPENPDWGGFVPRTLARLDSIHGALNNYNSRGRRPRSVDRIPHEP